MPCECRTEKWMEGAAWEDAPGQYTDMRRIRVPGGWVYREEMRYYLGVDDHRGDGYDGVSVSICFVPHPCGGE